MQFIGHLYRIWWARQAAFLPLRDAAANLYKETKAADVLLSDAGTAPRPAACLSYHGRQLVRYAKYGKVTLYGKKRPATAMEPITRNDLWAGRCADNMSSWIAENGVEYTELSLRHHDLRRVIQLVKRAMRDHDALLAWGQRHASSHRS